ncbi:MAG: hypothetical protein PHD15_02880 [Clostridia bacterium]|nr:hypothetical protein [Clostridia bacterium]MDD4386689.1 hypothetical protein [Clostridia bacterium]
MKIVLFDIFKDSKRTIKIEKYVNTFGESIYVYINESIALKGSIINRFKNKILEKYLSNIFKSKKFDESKYIYITSYEFDKNSVLKDKLNTFLNNRFSEVIVNDTIKKNSIKYLQSYGIESKILCIISEKIDMAILLSYIEKFKMVDFLYIGEKDNIFSKNINNINTEYGSTVSFINSIDLTIYNVYIVFNQVDLNGYILNRKSKYLDLTSSDNDIYSKEYRIFYKYSNEIVNKENFSKTRIGKLICIYLTDSV